MANNISPVAFTNGTVANGGTITVPANVAATHLGIAVLVSANQYSVGSVPTLPSWSNKASDPSIANQMEWNVFTRNGGLRAGDTIPVTVNNGTTFAYYVLWYDTSAVGANLDVNLVGAPGGRSTTNSAFTVINGINAAAGQQIIVVGSEKSTATGTNVTGFSGNYTPSTDAFAEDVGGTNTSTFFGHFAPTASGATGTVTLNYNTSSGNGVGVLLALGTPKTDSFHDPFTSPNYSSADTPPGLWQALLSETASPMGGGLLKMALSTDYGWLYPQMQLDFNNSSFTTEVYMDNVVQGSFSMRLTTDASPQSGQSFVSCGIAAGGGLYMNHRTWNGTASTDNTTNYSVTVAAGQAVVLRLRNAGSTTVYFDYSWDYENWTTLGSKTITCFNPQTDLPRPMFQAGSPVDHFDQFANVTQMNTSTFLSPPSAPWVAKTLWSYWNGTTEVALNPADSWNYVIWINQLLAYCSPTLLCATNLYVERDVESYPATNIYPDADYPGPSSFPDEQHPTGTDYPGSANFPGGKTYPDFAPLYPGGN